MNIVYISRSIIPSRTANSIHVMSMCNAFASLGHKVTLLVPDTKKLEEKTVLDFYQYYGISNTFTIKKIFSPNIKNLKKRIYSIRCVKEVEKLNPDLVYGRDDMLAFYLIYKKGFNVSLEKHEPFYEKDFNDVFFRKLSIENPNFRMITNSKALKQMYMDDLNINHYEVLDANNATNSFLDNKIPENVKINRNRIQVGYVGSLFKGRGIDIIIKLSNEFSQVDFHIIGGNEKDIKYWKKQVNNNNIKFHGFVEPKETYKYRNMCDILLAPYQSAKEGNRSSEYMSPIKVFEYMSSKKAIIISDLDVVYEVMEKNSALFVKYDDLDQWKNALQKLIDNEDLRKDLANNAFTKFNNNYTWEKRASKIISFLQQEKIVNLTDELYIEKGTNRACYLHPLDNKKCIKVTISGDHSESKKEVKYYKYLMKKKISFSNIAKYYGKVNTNLGEGDIFELIQDFDGRISKRLSYYLEDEQITRKIINPAFLLQNLFLYIKENNIHIQDLNTKNILYQKVNEEEAKLMVIDGIRVTRKIDFVKNIRFLVHKKMKKLINRFIKKLFMRYNKNKLFLKQLEEQEIKIKD